MKTKISAPFSFASWTTKIVLVLMIFVAQIRLQAAHIVRPENACLAALRCGDAIYASAALSPAASGGASITVTELFEDLPGFENAHLSATIVSGGNTLLVALTGFSGSQLPDNEVLGHVKITDNGATREFVVSTEGGLTVTGLADL